MTTDVNDFKCLRCMACCRTSGYVYLTEGEAGAIAAYLGIEISFFLNYYCDIIRPRFALKSFKNDACIFLTDYGCLIYDVRPRQCRTFPLQWRTKDAETYCNALRKRSR